MHSMAWVIVGLIELSIQLEINITRLDNCMEVASAGEEWPIEIQEVHYDYNNEGYIDHIHGKYFVRTIDTREKELTISIYKCPMVEPQPCERKVEHIITDLHCTKFQNDDTGIWHMVSQAMTGSTCGNETGLFKFEIPRANHEYFAAYLRGNEQNSRYRMHLLFHKKNEESKDQRACIEIYFDVFH